MNYSGKSFDSRWSDGCLYIHAKEYTDNCLDLMKIVLDAAMSQGEFSMIVDVRHLWRPSMMNCFSILSFVSDVKHGMERKLLNVAFLVDSYLPLWKTLLNTCTTKNLLITTSAKDAKLYIS